MVPDGETGSPSMYREHLEHCAECRAAVARSAAIRAYVARTAAEEVAPRHDIGGLALAAIRAREESVASVNEAFGTFGAIVRSIAHFAFGGRS